MNKKPSSSFEKAVEQRASPGLTNDIWRFLQTTRKWWMLLLIVTALAFGLILLLSETGLAPFIYTIF